MVDEADFARLSKHKWYAQSRSDGRFYAARREHHKGPLVYMHREVNLTPTGLLTDHIDGDTLNNRRANLRSASALQNAQNKAKQRSQLLKGAWLDSTSSSCNKWRAAIRLNGRLKYLGRFPNQEQAAAAYAVAAAAHFGEFNRSNP